MRTILVLIFLILFLILSIPLLIVLYFINKSNPKLRAKISDRVVRWVFKVVVFLSGTKITVIGRDNVPTNLDTGLLYVANHRSYFDIIVFFVSVPTLTGFIAKKEIAKVPLLKTWMHHINCLFLDRENIKEGLKTILQGIEYVKNGHSMFIAPEGTRNKQPGLLPFKEGSFKIAEKSGCPIIPVSMTGTDDVLENHFPWIKRKHVIIEYGKPIDIKELDKDQRKAVGLHVHDIIEDTLNKHHTLV